MLLTMDTLTINHCLYRLKIAGLLIWNIFPTLLHQREGYFVSYIYFRYLKASKQPFKRCCFFGSNGEIFLKMDNKDPVTTCMDVMSMFFLVPLNSYLLVRFWYYCILAKLPFKHSFSCIKDVKFNFCVFSFRWRTQKRLLISYHNWRFGGWPSM